MMLTSHLLKIHNFSLKIGVLIGTGDSKDLHPLTPTEIFKVVPVPRNISSCRHQHQPANQKTISELDVLAHVEIS